MATILVTGAARGIGNTLVRRAVNRGDHVIACLRKESDIEKFEAAPNLQFVIMDVSSTESVEQAFGRVDSLLGGKKLDAVVNSAAIQVSGALEVVPMADFENHYNTNTLGSVRIIRNALPRLRGHGGRLILVTSLWGRAAGPLLGAYCSSKHAIEALADVARRETVGQDVHIVVAQPGVVLTDMYTKQADEIKTKIAELGDAERSLYANLYRRYLKLVESGGRAAITADKAAENIEKAIFAARPRRRYQFGLDSKVVCFLAWLLPVSIMDFLLKQSLNNKPL